MVSSCFFLQAAQRLPFQILIPHLHLAILFFLAFVGAEAPVFLVVGFESDVAGILTDDQDFAFTAQIFRNQPAFLLRFEECLQVWKIAFVNGAVVVARVEKRLALTFRLMFARLETHQGIPDVPAGNALAIPVIPMFGSQVFRHRFHSFV